MRGRGEWKSLSRDKGWRSGCKVLEAIDKCAFALNKNIRKK